MPRITYRDTAGAETVLDLADGVSLMTGATLAGLVGIVGECGGNAMCATCHVYVEPGWLARVAPMGEEEDALLDGTAAERRPESRLSCQIKAAPALDGLIVSLPERQI